LKSGLRVARHEGAASAATAAKPAHGTSDSFAEGTVMQTLPRSTGIHSKRPQHWQRPTPVSQRSGARRRRRSVAIDWAGALASAPILSQQPRNLPLFEAEQPYFQHLYAPSFMQTGSESSTVDGGVSEVNSEDSAVRQAANANASAALSPSSPTALAHEAPGEGGAEAAAGEASSAVLDPAMETGRANGTSPVAALNEKVSTTSSHIPAAPREPYSSSDRLFADEVAPAGVLGDDPAAPILLGQAPESRGLSWISGLVSITGLTITMWALAIRLLLSWWNQSPKNCLSSEVKAIRVTSGSEIQSMFALHSGSERLQKQPMSPGILTRIRGRIVAKPEGTLAAPFSGRSCVLYSASVSRKRLDGIHSPPLAFHTAGNDFMIEMLDVPMSLAVHSHDVDLFDMADGLQERDQSFTGAVDQSRAFVMAHLVPAADASAHFQSCVDLSSDGTVLEFRECALLEGSMVTCVGEVARDRSGELGINPWRPAPLVAQSCGKKAVAWFCGKTAGAPEAAAAENLAALAGSASLKHHLVGRVMVTDSVQLS